MSTATNVFGSSSGSESPRAESTNASSTSRLIGLRPSAFVCQRCLRLLDMFPLSAELASTDIDMTTEGMCRHKILFSWSQLLILLFPLFLPSPLRCCLKSQLFSSITYPLILYPDTRRFTQVIGAMRTFQVTCTLKAVFRHLPAFL